MPLPDEINPSTDNTSNKTQSRFPDELDLAVSPETALGPNNEAVATRPELSHTGEFSDLDPDGLDRGLMTGMDQEANRSSNHSTADLLGRALVNTTFGIVKDAAIGTSYLADFEQHVNWARGTEKEFTNWFADWFGEQMDKDIFDKTKISRSPENEGFSPGSGVWWAAHAPSIATAVSLAIPAMGATKGLSYVTKMLGGAKILGKLSPTYASTIAQGAKGLSAAMFSRVMENTMESVGAVEEARAKLAAENPNMSEEQINALAGEAGRNVWTANAAMLALDVFQFSKMFSAANRINPSRGLRAAVKATAPKTWGKIATEGALTAGSEGLEEGYQFVVGKEFMPGDKPENFSERLNGYFKDGEFWTSVAMGALGGGVFYGASIAEKRQGQPQHEMLKKIQEESKKDRISTLKKDLSEDLSYIQSAVAHAHRGDLDTFERTLQDLNKLSTEEDIIAAGYNPKTFKQDLAERLSDVKFVEQLNNSLQANTKLTPLQKTEQLGFLMGERLINRKLNKVQQEIQTKLNDDIQNGMRADLVPIKQLMMMNLIEPTPETKAALEAAYEALIATGEFKNKTEIKEAVKTPNSPIYEQLFADLKEYRDELTGVKKGPTKKTKEEVKEEKAEEAAKAPVVTEDTAAVANVDEDMEDTGSSFVRVGQDVIVTTKDKKIRGKLIGIDKGKKVQTPSGEVLTFDDYADVKKAKNQSGAPITVNVPKAEKPPVVTTEAKKELSAPKVEKVPSEEVSEPTKKEKPAEEKKQESKAEKVLAADNYIHTVVHEFSDTKGILNLKDGLPVPRTNDQVSFDFALLNSPEVAANSEVILTYKQTTYGGKKYDTILVNVRKEGKLIPITQLKQQGYPESQWKSIVDKVKAAKEVQTIVKVKYTDPSNIVSTGINNNVRSLQANSPQHLPGGKIVLATGQSGKVLASEHIPFREMRDIPEGRTMIILKDPVGNNYPHVLTETKLEDIKYKDKSLATYIFGIAKEFYKQKDLASKVNLPNDEVLLIQQEWNDYRKKNIDPLVVNSKKYGFNLGLSKNNKSQLLEFIVQTDKKGEVITGSDAVRAALGNRFFKVDSKLLTANKPYKFNEQQYPSYVDFLVDMGIVTTTLYPQRPFRDSLLTIDAAFVNQDVPVAKTEVKEEKDNTKEIKELETIKGLIPLAYVWDATANSWEATVFIEPTTSNYVYFTNLYGATFRLQVPKELRDNVARILIEKKRFKSATEFGKYFSESKVKTDLLEEVNKQLSKLQSTAPLVKKRRGFSGVPDPKKINPKFRLKDPNNRVYTPYDSSSLSNELAWAKENLPQLPINVFENITQIYKKFGAEAHGAFTQGVVHIAQNSEVNTLYHEAFHAVYTNYLSKKQRNALFEQYGQEGDTETTFEERLARQFEDYKQGQKPKGILAKFFAELMSMIRELFGITRINDVYRKIDTGGFANGFYGRKSLPSGDNSIKFKLIEGYEVLEQQRRVDNILFLIVDQLQFILKVDSIINIDESQVTSDVLNTALANVRDEFVELSQQFPEDADVQKTALNINQLIERALAAFDRFGYKIEVDYAETGDEIVGETDTPDRIYDLNFFESSVKDTVSNRMKLYLGTLPRMTNENTAESIQTGNFYFDTDVLGDLEVPNYYDFNEIYAYLALNLTGMDSMDEMISFMKSVAETKPVLYRVIRDLEQSNTVDEGGVNNNSFRNEFFATFSKQYVDFLTIILESKEAFDPATRETYIDHRYKTLNTNNRSLPRTILSKWKENQAFNKVQPSEEKYKEFTEYVRKNKDVINDVENIDILKPIHKMLKDIGIDMSPEVLVLMRTAFYNSNPNGLFHDLLRDENNPSVGAVLKLYHEGGDIFGGTTEEKGEYTALRKLANYEAVTKVDRVIGSFISGEGNQVYSVNLNTYNSRLVQRLTKPNSRELKELLKVPYHKSSKILRDLADSSTGMTENFKTFVFDTVKIGENAVSYSDLNPLQAAVAKMNLFFNNNSVKYGHIFAPTPSDKGNSPLYRLPKMDAKDTIYFDAQGNLAPTEFKSWLTDTITDEYDRIKQALADYDNVPHVVNYHVNPKGGLGNAFFFNLYPELNDFLYQGKTPKDIVEARELFEEIDIKSEEVQAALSSIIVDSVANDKKYLQKIGLLNEKFVVDPKNYRGYFNEGQLNQFLFNNMAYTVELTKLLSGDMAYYKGSVTSATGLETQLADLNKRAGQAVVPGNDLSTPTENYSDTAKATFRVAIGTDVLKDTPLFKGVNIADAQGFITMNRLRDIAIGEGKFTPAYKKVWTRVNEGSTNPKDLKVVLQPTKGFYFAHRFDSGLAIPTQVKYSTIPLTKAFTQRAGNEFLENLRVKMETQKIDEYVFISGIKAGAEQLNDSNNLPEELSYITLENKNWRIPQVVPYKDKTEANFGRQIRVLITANLKGLYKAAFSSDPIEASELKNKYQNLIKANLKEGFEKVKARVGNVKDTVATIIEEIEKNSARALPDYYYDALAYIEDLDSTAFPMSFPLIKRKVENILNGIFRKNASMLKMPGGSAVQVSSIGIVRAEGDSSLSFVRLENDEILPAEVIVSPQFFLNVLKKKGVSIDFLLKEDGTLDVTKVPDPLRKMVLYRIPTQGKNSMLPVYIKDFTPAESGSIIYLPFDIVEQSGGDFDIDKVFIEAYNFEYDKRANELRKVEYIAGDDELSRDIQWDHYNKSKTRLLKLYRIIHEEYGRFLEYNRAITIPLQEILSKAKGPSNVDSLLQGFELINEDFFTEEEVEGFDKNIGVSYDYFLKLEAKTRELLTREEFDKLNEAERNNKAQRQNAILDIHYGILTSREHWAEITTPNNSNTLLEMKTEMDKIFGQKGKKYWNSLAVQEDFREKNQAGKQLVGAGAVVNTGYSFFQDLKVRLVENYPVYFKGQEKRSLSEVVNSEGTKITDELSEVVTAVVDNAKTPIAGSINLNLFTFPTAMLFVTAGSGLRYATYFINQPIIRDITEAYVKASGTKGSATSLDEAIEVVIKKYKLSPPERELENLKPVVRNFSEKELKDGLTDTSALNQQEVLTSFLYHFKLGDSMSRFVNAMSIDGKGNLPTMAENIARLRSLDRAKESKLIEFDEQAYLNHSFQGFENTMKGAMKELERYLPDNTNLFQGVLNRVSTAFDGADLSAKDILGIYDEYYTYLFTHKDSFYSQISTDEKYELLFGDEKESLARRVRAYIENTDDDKVNQFIKELFLEFDKNGTGLDKITFNNTAAKALSQEQKTILSDSLESMYRTGTPEEKAIVVDLFKYSYVTDGFNRSTGSFIDYLPLSLFKEFGLPDFWRGIETTLGFSEAYNEDLFLRQYVQHNYSNLPYLPKFKNFKELTQSDPNTRFALVSNPNDVSLYEKLDISGTWTKIHKRGLVINKTTTYREYNMYARPYSKPLVENDTVLDMKEQIEQRVDHYEIKCPIK